MSTPTPNYATCIKHGEVETTTGIVNGELVDLCPLCEREADLRVANLRGADLTGADLTGAK